MKTILGLMIDIFIRDLRAGVKGEMRWLIKLQLEECHQRTVTRTTSTQDHTQAVTKDLIKGDSEFANNKALMSPSLHQRLWKLKSQSVQVHYYKYETSGTGIDACIPALEQNSAAHLIASPTCIISVRWRKRCRWSMVSRALFYTLEAFSWRLRRRKTAGDHGGLETTSPQTRVAQFWWDVLMMVDRRTQNGL
jgi:hypothetical protein